MKSPYSKFIKVMLTSERMSVERSGDIYIVSNSYYAVKIPCCDYVSFFQPVSGVFIPLLAGQRFITRNLHEIPKPEEGSTCAKLFQSLNQHIPAAPTPFLIERKTNDGKLKPARIFFTKPSLCNPLFKPTIFSPNSFSSLIKRSKKASCFAKASALFFFTKASHSSCVPSNFTFPDILFFVSFTKPLKALS